MKELSDQQESFCCNYVFGDTRHNGTQSMRKAGYKEGYWKSGPTQLLENPKVAERIAELEEEYKQQHGENGKKPYGIMRLLKEIDEAIRIAKKKEDPRGILAGVDRMAALLGYKDNPTSVQNEIHGIKGESAEAEDDDENFEYNCDGVRVRKSGK